MSYLIFHDDAEISFSAHINGCFGGGFTELHLIPSEIGASNLFFQVNRSGSNSFVVEVSGEKARKLVERLLTIAIAEESMPKGRSTTSVTVKMKWKNISIPGIGAGGGVSLSKIGYVTPDDFREAYARGDLPVEKLEEIKCFIEKGMYSPALEISSALDAISQNQEEFIKYIEKL